MNRSDFQAISIQRVEEAQSLINDGHWPGAYYLIGYSVECALKACFAKQVNRYDFPDRKLTNDAYTHDLKQLFNVAGLWSDFDYDMNNNPYLEANWAVVKDWNESARYDLSKTETDARDLFTACTERNGVLPWIKRRW